MSAPSDGPSDDLDRLFARLQKVDPPPDLRQRVLRALPASPPIQEARRQASVAGRKAAPGWRWVAVLAGVALVLLSVRLGIQLDATGTLGIFGAAVEDIQGFMNTPGEYVQAIIDSLPWLELLLTLATLIVFWVTSPSLISHTDQAQRQA